jgi:hypothetical protein
MLTPDVHRDWKNHRVWYSCGWEQSKTLAIMRDWLEFPRNENKEKEWKLQSFNWISSRFRWEIIAKRILDAGVKKAYHSEKVLALQCPHCKSIDLIHNCKECYTVPCAICGEQRTPRSKTLVLWVKRKRHALRLSRLVIEEPASSNGSFYDFPQGGQ